MNFVEMQQWCLDSILNHCVDNFQCWDNFQTTQERNCVTCLYCLCTSHLYTGRDCYSHYHLCRGSSWGWALECVTRWCSHIAFECEHNNRVEYVPRYQWSYIAPRDSNPVSSNNDRTPNVVHRLCFGVTSFKRDCLFHEPLYFLQHTCFFECGFCVINTARSHTTSQIVTTMEEVASATALHSFERYGSSNDQEQSNSRFDSDWVRLPDIPEAQECPVIRIYRVNIQKYIIGVFKRQILSGHRWVSSSWMRGGMTSQVCHGRRMSRSVFHILESLLRNFSRGRGAEVSWIFSWIWSTRVVGCRSHSYQMFHWQKNFPVTACWGFFSQL